MASLPVEILFGIYLGLLVGMVPALISWALGFVFKYVTNVTLPGFGVAVLAIALAGVNGGLLAIADRSITSSPNAPRIVTAIVVVSMISMYAHNRGDNLGATLPKRLSLSDFRPRTLSKDFADLIGSGDEVRYLAALLLVPLADALLLVVVAGALGWQLTVLLVVLTYGLPLGAMAADGVLSPGVPAVPMLL